MERHEKVMELAARRGFIWPSYEIYGGVKGFYDFGPLGAMLKKKIEDKWREYYCIREGFYEIFCPTIAPEEVFLASGHVQNFVDPMVECEKCGEVFRANELVKEALKVSTDGLSYSELEKIVKEKKLRCPECKGELGGVWGYNLMFKTHIGPGQKKVGYLRPETAQSMFMLFNRLYDFNRKKLPFGVAQIGRAYRNEISPRQGVIRLREFNQAEVEIFVNPDEKTHKNFSRYASESVVMVPSTGKETKITADAAVEKRIVASELLMYHLMLVKEFLESVGIPKEKIRLRQHMKTEIAHYAQDCWDAEVNTERFGWIEVVGIADRSDYDIKVHEAASKTELRAFVQSAEQVSAERKVLVPKMKRLGLEFRKDAEKIVEIVGNLTEKEITGFEKNGFIKIKLGEREIKLDKEHLETKSVRETAAGKKIVPHVIEPSYGMDRIIYCILESTYNEREDRRVLSFKPSVSPVEVAVFPLVNKNELTEVALRLYDTLRSCRYACIYDDSDSIGRRYARVDEIGVPYAITIDFDTLKNKTATLRERDSTKQVRVKLDSLPETLRGLLDGRLSVLREIHET